MDHEPEVGLVEAHPEGRGGHQRLDPVGQQVGLGGAALGVLGATRVRGDREAATAQEVGDLVGRGHRHGVDDARARQLGQVVGQPAEAVGRVRERQHGEAETLPVERAAQHQGLPQGRPCLPVGAHGAQLLGDVLGDPRVGGGRGGQDRDAGREFGQHGAQPAVVGPEVVAPVGDTVRLVDHQQAGGGGELGQHVVAEVGVVQPLRADQQDVHLTGCHLGLDLLPLLRVGGVDGAGVDPGPSCRVHLIAHQGEQRGDDHRRTRAAGSQQGGGDEVDGGLAPPGALHHQGPAPVDDQRLDGEPLVLAQLGRGPASSRSTASARARTAARSAGVASVGAELAGWRRDWSIGP